MTEPILDLYKLADLRAFPEPEWLITGLLHQGDVGVIYGPPSSGKSFLALDWALSVANGTPWLDTYEVTQRPTLYMAGEGASSIYKRVRAWMLAHAVIDIPAAYFHLRPLPLREEEVVEEVQKALRAYDGLEGAEPGLHVGLVVVDTLSQFFSGGDEVSPDMTQFVNNMRTIARETGAAVLVVHHTNATAERERGHTSLRGNVEVMFRTTAIRGKDGIVGLTLDNDKQKDEAEAKSVKLALSISGRSLALSLATSHTLSAEFAGELPESLANLLLSCGSVEDIEQEIVTTKDVLEVTGLQPSRYHRNRDKLIKLKMLRAAGNGKYKFTPQGRIALSLLRAKSE